MPLKYFAVILQINLFSQGEAPPAGRLFYDWNLYENFIPSSSIAQYIIFTDYCRHKAFIMSE